MKQLLSLLDVRKGTQNAAGTGLSVVGLVAALLAMEGVDPNIKFGMGVVCVILILGLRAIAQAHNKDGTPAELPYQPNGKTPPEE